MSYPDCSLLSYGTEGIFGKLKKVPTLEIVELRDDNISETGYDQKTIRYCVLSVAISYRPECMV